MLAEMMRQMEQLSQNGELDKMVDGMMQQLMTKELLQDPMRELAEKVYW